jgi:hypothetical protein
MVVRKDQRERFRLANSALGHFVVLGLILVMRVMLCFIVQPLNVTVTEVTNQFSTLNLATYRSDVNHRSGVLVK